METTRRAGRTIGLLMLVQITAGLLVNFGLLGPVFASPGFLVNAAAHSGLMGASALLGIATGSLTVGIAIAVFPVFRQLSQTLALWFLALATASFAVAVIENI